MIPPTSPLWAILVGAAVVVVAASASAAIGTGKAVETVNDRIEAWPVTRSATAAANATTATATATATTRNLSKTCCRWAARRMHPLA